MRGLHVDCMNKRNKLPRTQFQTQIGTSHPIFHIMLHADHAQYLWPSSKYPSHYWAR